MTPARELVRIGAPTLKRACEVIRARRQYQSGIELARVFNTTWRVIAAICRGDG